MDLLLTCARGGLALVFIVAAVGKLLDAEGSRQALRDFEVPERLVGPGTRGLPLLELAIAAGLLAEPSAQIAAAAALALLATFALGVANALRRGREPDCNCFGQLHSAPAGRGTIARNVALAAPALFVLLGGPGNALAGGDGVATALVAVSAATATLAVAVYTLLRENQSLRAGTPGDVAQEHLAVGTPVPDLRVRDGRGESIEVMDLVAPDRMTAIAYVSPGCGPCDDLIPHLARWRSALAESVKVLIVSRMAHPDGPDTPAELYPEVFWDVDDQVLITCMLNPSPSAVLIDPDRTIASTPAIGYEAIEALLRVAERRNHTSAQPLAAA